MMSTNNILSPANGKPIIVPSQDIVLGLYYLSLDTPEFRELPDSDAPAFGTIGEIEHALHANAIAMHDKIKARWETIDAGGNAVRELVVTTPGRMMIAQILPKHPNVPFELINKQLTKKNISDVIDAVYRHCGQKECVIFADRLMGLGFGQAYKAGISFGKDDLIIPVEKDELIIRTQAEVKEFEQQYQDGLITAGERYNKVVDVWSRCTDEVAGEMMKEISKQEIGKQTNSVWMMSHSGARGSPAQMRQLAGMRGLMAKPSGEIIEQPIIANFKEGLSVLEYFNSTHGARKGLADTALKTANSGYLTRRLVDVAQDCIIVEEDCGTDRGLTVRAVMDGGEVVSSLGERILGRTTSEDVLDPVSNAVLVPRNTLIEEEQAERIETAGVESAKIRSVLTCESPIGVCAHCYGRDLARGTPVNIGEAVGVIAAQSIGEPGTQLTMRTFHIGGAAQRGAEQSSVEASHEGTVTVRNRNVVMNSQGTPVVMSRNCEIVLVDDKQRERARFRVPYGARLLVDEGQQVARGQKLAEWDPYTLPIITERAGKVEYIDLIEGITLVERMDEVTGLTSRVVVDYKQASKGVDLRPRLQLKDEKGEVLRLPNNTDARYFLSPELDPLGRQRRPGGGGRRAGAHPARGQQDPRHHRRSAARGRAVRGPPAEGSRGHRRNRRPRGVRQGLQGQAPGHREERRDQRGDRVPDPQGQARLRPGGRLRPPRRSAGRWPARAARHPEGARRRGAVGLPGERNPGRLSAAGREDQRQAHRGDRSPDAAEGRDPRSRRHHLPRRRAGRPHRVRRGQCQARQRRSSGAGDAGAAGHHQGLACRPTASSAPPPSRRRRGC